MCVSLSLSRSPKGSWVTFWTANITTFICLLMPDLFSSHLHDQNETQALLFQRYHFPQTLLLMSPSGCCSPNKFSQRCLALAGSVISHYFSSVKSLLFISVSSLFFFFFLLQINCVTFPLPGEGPEQQLLKPNEWSYCDYFWVSSTKTQELQLSFVIFC